MGPSEGNGQERERRWGYEALVEAFDRFGYRRTQVGTAPLGTPIYAYDTHPDPSESPVVMAAGAHAEEAAGVFAALRIAAAPETAQRILFVPCRDPLGWDGVRATFQRATGRRTVPMRDHDEAVAAFRKFADVIFEDDGIVIGAADDLAFCSFAPDHPAQRDTGEFIQRYLAAKQDTADVLRGKRLYVPGSPHLSGGRDPYGWSGGPTVYVDTNGRVGNFNRFFSADDPPEEVAAMKRLADGEASAYAFDLHENFGDRFGMYASQSAIESGEPIYRAMIDAVVAAGYELMPLAALLTYLDVPKGALLELYPGVYAGNWKERRAAPDAFGPYLSELGAVCFTTEMGMENDLELRTRVTETAVRAGLAAIEAACGRRLDLKGGRMA